jgi:DNA polymerase
LTKKEQRLKRIATKIRRCRKCPLAKSRKNAVPGEGAYNARIMLIGEAPGRAEDEQGLPFVGYAGNILDEVLKGSGLQREQVFITSILKCRPPDNRNPKAPEISACEPHLVSQVDIISPKVLVALGRFGLRGLTGKTGKVGDMRKKKLEYNGVPIVITYHPAAIIYNRKLQKTIISDLEKARRLAGR